jgi:hypothetical protein
MAWYKRLWQYLDYRQRLPQVSVRAMPRGRTSTDSGDSLQFGGWFIAPPADYEANWQLFNLRARDLECMDVNRLMEVMADVSPEVSRALHDFQLMCNPGWEARAHIPGQEEQHEAGQAALDEFLSELDDLHGAVDVIFGRYFLAAFLRGALFAELVLDRGGRMPVDLVAPDPASVRFRKRVDPVRGVVWQLGQWQDSGFVPLDLPTVRYVPINPYPGSPYGRPLAAPALFTALFLLNMLHDLRRVIQQQGYPRLDLSIDTEKLRPSREVMVDPGKLQEWTQAIVAMVEEAYGKLAPDDAYIHTDVVSVNRPVGTVDASSLGMIGDIIAALERMAVRALKTMPLMMGVAEGVTEANANRQWELYAAGIKSMQHYAETMLERLLTLALEAQGIQAEVQFRFAELRAAEELRDAQTEAMQISNAQAKYEAGWISQDEAAEEITGVPQEIDSTGT